jgi:hypothetical protein
MISIWAWQTLVVDINLIGMGPLKPFVNIQVLHLCR